MLNRLSHQSLRYHAPVLVCLLAIVILLFLPTGFEGALLYQEAERCTARVLEVDNSTIVDTGLVRSGEQRCSLEIRDGMFAGPNCHRRQHAQRLAGAGQNFLSRRPWPRWWSATTGTPSPM